MSVIGHDQYFLANVIDEDLYRMSDIWRYSGRNVQKLENIAEHSYYVTFKVFQLGYKYGISEERLNKAVKAAMCHDCGEIYTGDLPHSLKVYSPDIKRISEELEVKLIKEHFPEFGQAFEDFANDVDPVVTTIVLAADCLDAIMYVNREEEIGNRNKDIIEVRSECTERYIKLITKLEWLLEMEAKADTKEKKK